MNFIKIEKLGRIATVVVDRPKSLNALNADVLLELRSAFLQLDGVGVVILTGAGDKAFVAGADISSMAEFGPLDARTFVELGQGVMQTIEEAPFVTIAAINGFALGGGLELALACDLLYASDTAKLGLPETNLGIVPGFGGTQNLLQRVGMHRSLEMILTGKTISAAEAKAIGLVLDVFPASELSSRVHEIATKMSKKGLLSLLAARRLVRAHCSDSKSKGYLLEREVFATLFASGEPREGMTAFLEKREARFSWPGENEVGTKI